MPRELENGQLGFTNEEMGIKTPQPTRWEVPEPKAPIPTKTEEVRLEAMEKEDPDKKFLQMYKIAKAIQFEKDPLAGANMYNPYPDAGPMNLIELLRRELGNGDNEKDGYDVLARNSERYEALTKIIIERLDRDPKKMRQLGEALALYYSEEIKQKIELLEAKKEEIPDNNNAPSYDSRIRSINNQIENLKDELKKSGEFGFLARYYLLKEARQLDQLLLIEAITADAKKPPSF